MEGKIDFKKCVVLSESVNLDNFIDTISVDEDTKVVLSVLKKYSVYDLRYEPLKEVPNIFKCSIEYYQINATTCNFSFLFQFKKTNNKDS